MIFEEVFVNFLKIIVSIQGWDSFLILLKSIFVVVGIVSVGIFIWFIVRLDVLFEEKDVFQWLLIEIDVV